MAPPVEPGQPNIFGHRKPTAEQLTLDAKREYNIQIREQKYDAKQKELAAVRKQRKQAEQDKRERAKRAQAMKRQANIKDGIAKKQNNMEDDYRQRNREASIAQREERWQTRMHEYITNLLDAYQDRLDAEQEARTAAKQAVIMEAKSEAKTRAEKTAKNEQMQEDRLESIRKRDAKRLQLEMVHCEELKQEIEEDIEYKIECIDQGIPTKVTMNDMVKSLVPVPSISELLCAVKSELDEIKYLKQVDLEALANLVGQPPLLFVKQLNEEHEKNKLLIPTAVPISQNQ